MQATIPPKALIGSLACAFKKDWKADLFEDTPQGFACLIITVVGLPKFEKRISNKLQKGWKKMTPHPLEEDELIYLRLELYDYEGKRKK